MRGWLIGGAVAVLAVAALTAPLRSHAVVTAPTVTALDVEAPEFDACGTAEVTAGLEAVVREPVVGVLGLAWVTDVRVTDARLVVSQAGSCADGPPIVDGIGGITPTGECTEWAGGENGTEVAVDCRGAGVRLSLDLSDGGASVASADPLAIAGGRATADRWCLRVDAGLGFQEGGAYWGAGAADPGELCLDLR